VVTRVACETKAPIATFAEAARPQPWTKKKLAAMYAARYIA
jgi:hypothetical protein